MNNFVHFEGSVLNLEKMSQNSLNPVNYEDCKAAHSLSIRKASIMLDLSGCERFGLEEISAIVGIGSSHELGAIELGLDGTRDMEVVGAG